MKTAGVILIGDEVLKGQVVDQNLVILAPKLHKLGIKLKKVSIIPDSVDEIAKEVAEFSSKFDTVITTGGVGPTHDDVTYEGIARAFNEELVLSDDIVKFWSYYTGDPEAKQASTKRLATIPKSSVILYPDVGKTFTSKGTFPIVSVRNVVVCPGVPKFLSAIFTALEGSYFNSLGVVFYNRAIYLKVSEQVITDTLNEAVSKFSPSVQFGSYPKFGNDYYRVILTLESESEPALEEAYDYLTGCLKSEWMAEDGDLLGNAHKRTMELIGSSEEELAGFRELLKESMQVVEKSLDDYSLDELFISFNGGKDCTALLHLVHSVLVKRHGETRYPTLTGVYFKSPNAFKEVEDFIFEAASRYNLKLITHEGKIKDGLIKLMQEDGKNWKACFMGVRRQDPNCSNLNPFQETDAGWPCLMRVSPLLDWCYSDVWTYLRRLGVPYCPLYDRGYTSLGNAHNTKPNPALEYTDPKDGLVKYKPAYLLGEDVLERRGRTTSERKDSEQAQFTDFPSAIRVQAAADEGRRRSRGGGGDELAEVLTQCLGPGGQTLLISSTPDRLQPTRAGCHILPLFTGFLPRQDHLIHSALEFERKTGDGSKSIVILTWALLSSADNITASQLKQLRTFSRVLSQYYTNLTSTYSLTMCEKITSSFYLSRFPQQISVKLSQLHTDWLKSNNELVSKFDDNVHNFLLKYFNVLVITKKESLPFMDSKIFRGIYVTGNYYGALPAINEKYSLFIQYHSSENESNEDDVNYEVQDLIEELHNYDSNGILIVTNCNLPFTSLQLLSKYKIVTQVPCEIVQFLFEYSLLEKKLYGRTPSVSFSLTNSHSKELFLNIPFYSFHLNGAHASLTQYYSEAIRSCLKLCKYTQDMKSLVTPCKLFEKLFSLHITATFADEWFIPIVPCSMLHEWNSKLTSIKNKTFVSEDHEENVLNEVFRNLMDSLIKSNVTLDPELATIICQSLLNFHMKISSTTSEGFEPLTLKFEILLSVLTTFCSLMNIDTVFKIKSTSKSS